MEEENSTHSLQIIAAADEALRRAGAPICFLHREGYATPNEDLARLTQQDTNGQAN